VLWNERGLFLCLILSLTHQSSSVAMGPSRGRDVLLTARKDTMRYDDDMRRVDPGQTEDPVGESPWGFDSPSRTTEATHS
jgi:hypothetical protein